MSRKSRIALPLLVGCSVFILTRNPVLALLAWPALRLVDRLWKRYSESRAKARKEEEVLEFIDSLIQSLRSGLSLQQALEQSREDLGNEMRRDLIPILKELHMGAGLEESLSRAAASQDIPSLRLTLTVLALLHSRGGDLPRILERLRKRVAEGVEVRREARILTSQSRASGYLVSALPPVFLLIQGALNPKSLQPLLATPAGNLMIVVGLLLNAAAFVFIRRIVRQGE
jgi:tight adherence protein B